MELTMTHLVILTFLGFVVTILTIVFGSGKWRGKIETLVSELKQSVEALTKRVDKVYDWLAEQGMRSTLGYGSPLDLTDLGRKISENLQLENMAAEHVNRVKILLDEKDGAYEIQQLCLRYATELLPLFLQEHSPDKYKAMTMVAYKEGIPIEAVLGIVGILIRNKLVPPI